MIEHINLNTEIEKIARLSPLQKKALKKMGLVSIGDLLYFFPTRYGTAKEVRSISNIKVDEEVVVYGKVDKPNTGKTWGSRTPKAEMYVDDGSARVRLIWFSQPYIAKMFGVGSLVRVEGKVSAYKESLTMVNPKIEKVAKVPEGGSDSLFADSSLSTLEPTYRESRGITSNWIYHMIQKVFRSGVLEETKDPIPEKMLEKYSLPSLKTSLVWIHTPKNEKDALAARKRFSFEEILLIQLDRQKEKMLAQKEKTFQIKNDKPTIDAFVDSFGFPLTSAQKKSVDTILSDFKKSYPMSRLLEGDVGSGKTAVAAVASYALVTTPPPDRTYGSLQVAYMAPTEILANQHFESFINLFKKYNIAIGLITGSGAKKFPAKTVTKNGEVHYTDISKSQLKKWVENGEIPILIGTHALIQKSVIFKNLGLIVIDEQHRFGVKQRMQLRKKPGLTPHLLSMTATPIPRTLALTVFGDLDLSLLDELPKGRKRVNTQIALEKDRESVYQKIREELKKGRQAYVICPRIEAPDMSNELAVDAKSVEDEAKRLREKLFKDFRIATLTGKHKPKEKEKIMQDMHSHKFDILVATSVVEVGVNIPNATAMIIENAERFGLSQLHQLRGRIMRSSHEPHCFVFAQTKSQNTIDRLRSFVKAKNGFELAEMDMQQRGIGDLVGIKQWGISDLAMEALRNIKMVEAAREEAQNLLHEDFGLENHPLLKNKLAQKQAALHME